MSQPIGILLDDNLLTELNALLAEAQTALASAPALAARIEDWRGKLEGVGQFDASLLPASSSTGGQIELTAAFWDCECEKQYIHPWHVEACPRCKAQRADQPPARIDEVLAHAAELAQWAGLVDEVRQEQNQRIILRCMAAQEGWPQSGDSAHTITYAMLVEELAEWLVDNHIQPEQVSQDTLSDLLDEAVEAITVNWQDHVQAVFADVWERYNPPYAAETAPDAHLEAVYEDAQTGWEV